MNRSLEMTGKQETRMKSQISGLGIEVRRELSTARLKITGMGMP
jgi:hypothetical protein